MGAQLSQLKPNPPTQKHTSQNPGTALQNNKERPDYGNGEINTRRSLQRLPGPGLAVVGIAALTSSLASHLLYWEVPRQKS